MERVHKDNEGNIISYEDWKGVITSQQDMTAYILKIQTEQLAECKKMYNNTCYNELLAKVTEENSKLTLKSNAYSIFRGQNLDEFVSNWARKHNVNPLQDGTDAMQKLAEFALNYPHNFIEECFADTPNMAQHFRSKFNAYYETATSYGALIALIAALGNDNKVKLFNYILSK